MKPLIVMGHGAGGRMSSDLIREIFLPAFSNPHLETLSDAAVLPEMPPGRPAMTTDAFVVDPPVFPGGDLGTLAVTGTVNDLAVSGAVPLWLSLAVILEEGTPLELVESCARSAAATAREAGVAIVAGDTKVVPRGKGDGIYAVTAGLGVVPPGEHPADGEIRDGDVLIVSGPLGDHGATIMALRHGLQTGDLRSDCGCLNGLTAALREAGVRVHSMHDPTRGGLATVAAEAAERCGLQALLDEEHIPVRPEVGAVCGMLGLDPLYLACEGRLVLWLPPEDAARALEIMRQDPAGGGAVRIGTMRTRPAGGSPVLLKARSGGLRPLDILSGSGLPRIC